MLGKNNYRLKQKQDKVYRYSLRKYHFGVASVAISALMFLTQAQAVYATEAVSNIREEAVAVIDKKETKETNQPSEPDKKEAVDTLGLRKGITELQKLLQQSGEFVNESVLTKAKEVLLNAEQLLQQGEITQTALDKEEQTILMLIQQLQQEKHDSETSSVTTNSTTSVNSAPNAKETKLVENEKDTNADSTSNSKSVSHSLRESKISVADLKTLVENTQSALVTAEKLDKPENQLLLQKVRESLRSASDAIQANATDVQTIYSSLNRSYQSVMNVILREHSGKRDRRTGDSLGDKGSGLREGTSFDNATVGWFIKDTETETGYLPGTFVYASHNDNNSDKGRRPVKLTAGEVYAKVTNQGNTYHWTLLFNRNRYEHQSPRYYFTLPVGHTPGDAVFKENGKILAKGPLTEAFFCAR